MYEDDDWRSLLARAVEQSSCAAVGRKLGISRTAVSLLLAGKYKGKSERMAALILEQFSSVECPIHGRKVARAFCVKQRAEALPTANPFALRAWLACQKCSYFTTIQE